jgi:hypothetical protein
MNILNLNVLFFILASLSINKNANATIPAIEDRGIVRINENMFVGKKRLPYKNIDGNRNKNGAINTTGDNVYFVFQKLTDDNNFFWKNHADDQNNKMKRNGVATQGSDGNYSNTYVHITEGIRSFQETIKLFNALKCDIWIAYATRKNPNTFGTNTPPSSDVEMVFSVFLNRKSPITTHMGIFRNYTYFRLDKQPHLNLAIELHAFSAKVSNQIYDEKSYMVTKPVHKMRQILIKSFEDKHLKDYICVGDTIDREKDRESRRSLIQNTNVIKAELDGLEQSYNQKCQLFPKDLSYIPPLDNRHPSDWTLHLSNGETQAFTRPDWFGITINGERQKGHVSFFENLPTTMVDIKVLASFWDEPVVPSLSQEEEDKLDEDKLAKNAFGSKIHWEGNCPYLKGEGGEKCYIQRNIMEIFIPFELNRTVEYRDG